MDKRQSLRVPLDIPFWITARSNDGQERTVMLLDCGRGGAQLAFSPKEPALDSLLHMPLNLLGLPGKLGKDPAGCSGIVVWMSPPGRCGVRFDTPLVLTDEELREATREL